MKNNDDGSHTILLIDDDQNILASLKRLFRKEPFTVLIANGGFEALEILESCEVDLVICDYTMPGPSGSEVLKLIKERWPETVRILMTGHYDTDILVKAINDGEAYRFIQKPWNDDELLLTTRQALEKVDLKRENQRLIAEMKRYQETLSSLEDRFPGISSKNIDEEGYYIASPR
jgi:DNA-binding NtrC family response regulator